MHDLTGSSVCSRSLALVALCLAGLAGPQLLPAAECSRIVGEDDDSRIARCRRENSATNFVNAQRSAAQVRAELEREPPLPAARNPLLGRWQPQSAASGKSGDIVGQLAGMLSNTSCTMMFGAGAIEFRQRTMVSIEHGVEESLGTVSYRGRKNRIFVLPDQGVRLMPFEFNGANQVSFTAGAAPCTLNRVEAGQQAAVTPLPKGGGAVSAAPSASQSAPGLSDKTAYRCPTGELLFVDACAYGTPAEPTCWTERYDLPKVNGRVQVVMEKRTDLGKRLQRCEAGGFRYAADGSPVFLPAAR